ncbi:hypothetical protein ABKV19_026618 [Rosa sericea]
MSLELHSTCLSTLSVSDSETGALCAMKEVDLIPHDPKSAESIKQSENSSVTWCFFNVAGCLVCRRSNRVAEESEKASGTKFAK